MNEAQEVQITTGLARALDREVKRINGMSKLKGLAQQIRDDIANVEAGAEKLAERSGKLRQRGADVYSKLHGEFDTYEQAVNEAEQSLSQLSNGGPPLGNG